MVKVTTLSAVSWGSVEFSFEGEAHVHGTVEFKSLGAFSRRFLNMLRTFRPAEDGETICLKVRLERGVKLLRILSGLARTVEKGKILEMSCFPNSRRLLFELLDGKVLFEEAQEIGLEE